jgi:hypothetical protein
MKLRSFCLALWPDPNNPRVKHLLERVRAVPTVDPKTGARDYDLVWTGYLDKEGYGRMGRRGAHRVSWELAYGRPPPPGLELDHVAARGCRSRACVNPRHLEAVTHHENIHRGNTGKARGAQMKARTHCPKGHEYTVENTYVRPTGARVCIACRNEQRRQARRATRGT